MGIFLVYVFRLLLVVTLYQKCAAAFTACPWLFSYYGVLSLYIA